MKGKKVKRHKSHIVTNIEGHLLHVKAHIANIHNTKSAPDVLDRAKEKFSSIKGFSADEEYRGTTADNVEKNNETSGRNFKEDQRSIGHSGQEMGC